MSRTSTYSALSSDKLGSRKQRSSNLSEVEVSEASATKQSSIFSFMRSTSLRVEKSNGRRDPWSIQKGTLADMAVYPQRNGTWMDVSDRTLAEHRRLSTLSSKFQSLASKARKGPWG